MAAHQALQSLGFSRQEHWSGQQEGQVEGEGKRKEGKRRRKRKQEFLKMRRTGRRQGLVKMNSPGQGRSSRDLEG